MLKSLVKLVLYPFLQHTLVKQSPNVPLKHSEWNMEFSKLNLKCKFDFFVKIPHIINVHFI